MLEDDGIQDLFGSILGDVYESAVLITKIRLPLRDAETGAFSELTVTSDVRAQRDSCTSKQMRQSGYSDKDVRLMVLQSGVGVCPDTDSRVVYRHDTYMVMDIDEDPFRIYWDLRARKM